MTTALFGICAALISASPLRAATNPAPAPIDVLLRQSNAQLHRFVLENGMICLVKEDHSAPVAAVQIWVGTGAINEGEHLGAGLSHFVEHMIFKGTPTRAVGDISREINDAGGEINAYTAHDRTVFHTTLPSRSWSVGLDVLADAVMNANFPSNEWARERDVILREFAMGRDDPDREIAKLLWSTAYRVHPYRFPVIGYEDIFKSTTHNDLVRFFHGNYVPDNMITVVVGDVNAEEVEARLREVFKPFARRARAPEALPTEPPQIAPRKARRTGAYEVSRLTWCCHIVALDHPDAPALDVLAAIVGSGRSSRLALEIKEKQKLVYGIDAWSSTPKEPGLFGISASFDPTNETAVLKAIEAEVDSWSTNSFTDEEIAKARRMVLVNELSGLQTMDGQAYSFASGEFYAADPLFSERYLQNVEKVDAETLRAMVARYFTSANRTVAILAPESAAKTAAVADRAVTGAAITKVTLSNGVPLIVREDHRLPFVHFCTAFRGGLLSETADNNGITQLLSDLLTRGTETRTAEEIAATVEQLGGSLSPFSGRNSFGLKAQCLSGDADTFAELMADCLLRPAFPEVELEKQRTIQLAAIQQQREQPFFIAEEALRQTLHPNHPYRWTPQGTREPVQGITRDAVRAHFRQNAARGNMAISVFGDITAAQAAELAERWFSAMPGGSSPEIAPPESKPELPSRIKQRQPKQQTILLVGYPGVDVKDPRADALTVMESALSGLSSELGTEVREKRGLVYSVGALDRPGLDSGLFALYAGTQEKSAANVEALMDAETRRLAEEGLRKDEFRRAVEQIIAAQQMSLQGNGTLAQACALNELYGLGYDYSLKTEKRMRALTRDRIREAAASIFKPDRRAVSLVLPGETAPEKETSP